MGLKVPVQAGVLLCAHRLLKHGLQPHSRPFTTTISLLSVSSAIPRVVRPAFWTSLIPKPFRRTTDAPPKAPRKINPMTPFIILGILVGSNAINLIALRNEMLNFSRKTDAKLALLREVIGKVKNGEEVDVRRALGTGDPKEEAEWEDVIKELEQTDMLWEGHQKRQAERVQRERKREREMSAAAREGKSGREQAVMPAETAENGQGERQTRPKFLM